MTKLQQKSQRNLEEAVKLIEVKLTYQQVSLPRGLTPPDYLKSQLVAIMFSD